MTREEFHTWITAPQTSAQLDRLLAEFAELDRQLAAERDTAEAERRDAVVARYLRRFGQGKSVWGGR